MLSIQPRAAGCDKYYLSAAISEYYLTDSESSLWLGKGAEKLHLSGPVHADDFRALLFGYGPDGAKLTQNAGADKRPAGWDLTFSMPKSAGVLWAVTDDATRAKIEAAHLAAVTAGIGYLEQSAAYSRTVTKVMVNGQKERIVEHQRAGLVVAGFHHGTSRLDCGRKLGNEPRRKKLVAHNSRVSPL
jgi:conjugative relaxase-like TrwC/TraI family protein